MLRIFSDFVVERPGSATLLVLLLTLLAAGALIGCAAAPAVSAAPAVREPAGELYGLRLGQALKDQLVLCGSPQAASAPCVDRVDDARDARLIRSVQLPRAVIAETGLLSVRDVRVEGGRVVEIELEGHEVDLARLRRSVMARKGPPVDTETYERGSRVWGVGRVRLHTWKDETNTLLFDERSVSDHPRLRAYDNAWARQEARRR